MSAEIVCPHCQTRYPARAELYGRRVACKKCKQTFSPPALGGEGGVATQAADPDEFSVEKSDDDAIAQKVEKTEFPPPLAPKDRQKKKKKKQGIPAWVTALPLGRDYDAETKLHVVVALGLLGIPTALTLLTGGWNPVAALASGVCALTILTTGLWAFFSYCQTIPQGRLAVLICVFFPPLALVLLALAMFWCLAEYPQIPIAFLGAILCIMVMSLVW